MEAEKFMNKSYKEINQKQRQLGRTYREKSPDTMNAFLALHKAALADGALSNKHKELIATGIAIAARCDGCIASHVAASLKAGASKEELLETIDVAVLMGGGPALIYGTQALAAVEELSE
jgi:AhpD family alkylhydroperoxidase